MTLIAQHKYGVRISTDSKWKEFLAHLGESAAAFELLQTKPSGAVKINFDCSAGSSKGEYTLIKKSSSHTNSFSLIRNCIPILFSL